ncbi:MAG: hypothetical protein MJE68_08035, partial [Proteobacteria bacterium]|nr:hypothetical protein [Pseudomonadota bacterium]
MKKLGKRKALRGSQLEYFLSPEPRVGRDLSLSVADVYAGLEKILRKSLTPIHARAKGVKFQLRAKVLLEKYSFENDKQIVVDVWFPSNSVSVHTLPQIARSLRQAIADMMSKFDAFVQKGSGWVVREVKMFSLTVNKFTMFSGGGKCASLPTRVRKACACISVGKHCDKKCFLRCVVAAVYNSGKNVGRWCKGYDRAMSALESVSSSYLTFPVDVKGIKKFEKNWPICINVYGYSDLVYPHYLSMKTGSPDVSTVNLLLYRKHYYLICNMSSLVAPQLKKNRRKCYVCSSCLSYFVSEERYKKHTRLCKKDGTQYAFPEPNAARLEFSLYNSMVNAPFVIYADLETMITREVRVTTGKTTSKRKHVPVSVGALTVCRDRPEFGSEPFLYTGLDCIEMRIYFLNNKVVWLRDK